MKLAILKIILWPKNPELKPRIIPFKHDHINIITGESASGKSSLTWIIDYCLGSSKCSIPVGIIRDNVAWFGLHLQLPDTQMLVARPNPGQQKETDNYYIHEAQSVAVVDVPVKNARRDDLVNRLNELAQLPQLDFATNELKQGYKTRTSVRDMVAFCFLPQHIVANQYTLFYRTDTTVHRERLRNALPLALGAMDAQSLELQHELIELQRQEDRKQRELASARKAVDAWQAQLRGYYARAKELGLTRDDKDTSSWSTDDFLRNLRQLSEHVPSAESLLLSPGTVERAAQELAGIAEQEVFLSRELARLRRRMAQMLRLRSNATEYRQQLDSQQDRLQGVPWFQEYIAGQTSCPVCLSTSATAATQVQALATLTKEVARISTAIAKTPPVVDKELAELRIRSSELEEQLNAVRKQKQTLDGSQKQRDAHRYLQAETFRFIGGLEQALETVTYAQPDSELGQSLARISERIRKIRATLDPQLAKIREETALNQIATKISHYAEHLQLERGRNHIKLDLKELTLQFRSEGRSDYLFEIGSGQNWMGYHISALCALQEFFVEQKNSPVPQFLVIDQPSQVYFPEAWPTVDADPIKNATTEKKSKMSADIAGVRRVFEALAEFRERTGNKVQVIVTEHAGEITWQGIKGVHVVGNWREDADEFLIPSEWLRS
jgi:uncharacterized Zn finger protein (UPF0148 family)